VSKKRYGDRNWGPKGVAPIAHKGTSSFEEIVENLGLSPEQYASSDQLKEWARINSRQKYAPIDLLKTWGFEVEPL